MTSDVGYLAAFAGGVVSFLSPCVLPIVPAYLAIITGLDVEQLRDADRPLVRIIRDTVLFIAGFSAVFVALGLSATTIGRTLFRNQSLLTRVSAGDRASLQPGGIRRPELWQAGYSCCRYRLEEGRVPRTGALTAAIRVEPSAADRDAAAVMVAASGRGRGRAKVVLPDGTTVPLSPALLAVLQATAGELAGGHAVTVLPSEVLLTPAEAAELLGLSRPFVVRLLDDGEIPAERLPRSRHRRIRLTDVLAFQSRRAHRRAGRQRIAAEVDSADLPY